MEPEPISAPKDLSALTGPFYDAAGLRAWLGIDQQDLDDRVDRHEMLAAPAADGSLLIPAWQFTTDKKTIPHLADVLRILASGINDPWTWAMWLCAPDDDLAGLTSAQWLAAAHDPEPVLTEAARDAAHWRL